MNNKKYFTLIVAGLFIVAIIGWFTPWIPRAKGGTGSLAIEDYNPTIMYNRGYYSALPIETTGNLTVGGTMGITGVSTFTGASVFNGVVSINAATTMNELTEGGSVLATSTTGTATIPKASDFLTYSVWEVTPNTADLTYTFPASSTLATLIPTAGDMRTWTIYNATTTAGIDVIFAAGTGEEIKGVGGGALTIDEASFGLITLTRKANSDILITTFFPTAD